MVKTLPFHCWGCRLDPWVGELRSHMPCSAEVGVGAKKKKKDLPLISPVPSCYCREMKIGLCRGPPSTGGIFLPFCNGLG